MRCLRGKLSGAWASESDLTEGVNRRPVSEASSKYVMIQTLDLSPF